MRVVRRLLYLLITLDFAIGSSFVHASIISKISISGNSSIPQEAIEHNLRLNNLVVGSSFDESKLEIVRQHIVAHYHDFRRNHAEVKTNISYLNDDKVDINLDIHELNETLTTNNTLPYDEYIFSDTGSDNQGQSSADGVISFGLGYGNKGVSTKLSLIKRNLWDTNVTLRVSGRHDRYEKNAEIGIVKPNFFFQGANLDTVFFYDVFDNKHGRTVSPYRRKSYGLELKLNFPLDTHTQMYGGIRYARNKVENIANEYHRAKYLVSVNRHQWVFKGNDLDFLLGWSWNNLNQKTLPTKGFSFKVDGSVSLPGSENHYYKSSLEMQLFYPIDSRHEWVLGIKTYLAYAKGMSGYDIPFYQRYTAGGQGTIRGFAYGAIGPQAVYSQKAMPKVLTSSLLYNQKSTHIIGGNALATGSIELKVPSFFIPQKYQTKLHTSLFVDVANVWDTSNVKHPLTLDNYHARHVRLSAGLSLQWKLPVGIVAVSYAIPIQKKPRDRIERLQLNLMGSF
ncbi:BamA/TamA family outer membrane protein [Pelistega sp. MC2]|uniref:BamA/TamA family outer membrane protein n=1 Tax=Pelistega sp. MC2 TaxID=1720297 RepID=UPI0008D95B60|nr:BamA/TamA family outer membrane protein [Pelistega sp. MC2]